MYLPEMTRSFSQALCGVTQHNGSLIAVGFQEGFHWIVEMLPVFQDRVHCIIKLINIYKRYISLVGHFLPDSSVGPASLRLPVQLEKYGLKLKVVLKCRDFYWIIPLKI